jgi:phage FluMu protein Com
LKAPKQNCPRCNAVQSFRPRRRYVNCGHGVIDVYIRCTVCNWESILRQSTVQIELLMANERRLLEQARVQRVRFGVVNRATARLLTDIALAKSEAREVAGL